MNIISLAESDEDRKKVKTLAERLNLTIIAGEPDKKQEGLALYFDAGGLSLVEGGLAVRGDFTQMLPRLKTANLRGELLIRAAKIKNLGNAPTAIDATAGLGEDAILLAAAGFTVQLYEYNSIIEALLQDALQRASMVPELTEIVSRMQLFKGDSIQAMSCLKAPPDIILLDPMFPARQKSGLVKKKFQLIGQLEHPCSDEKELMQAAMQAHPGKILVKRPSRGPFLAGIKPNYSIEGKGIRYDCITT